MKAKLFKLTYKFHLNETNIEISEYEKFRTQKQAEKYGGQRAKQLRNGDSIQKCLILHDYYFTFANAIEVTEVSGFKICQCSIKK